MPNKKTISWNSFVAALNAPDSAVEWVDQTEPSVTVSGDNSEVTFRSESEGLVFEFTASRGKNEDIRLDATGFIRLEGDPSADGDNDAEYFIIYRQTPWDFNAG
jgi:hypothetical protein